MMNSYTISPEWELQMHTGEYSGNSFYLVHNPCGLRINVLIAPFMNNSARYYVLKCGRCHNNLRFFYYQKIRDYIKLNQIANFNINI